MKILDSGTNRPRDLSDRFYSIDPGTKFLGISRWFHNTLERAWLQPVAEIDSVWFRTDDVVVEMPQQDRRTRRVRMKDVLNLTATAGRIAGRTDGDAAFVTPKQWKNSLPKDVCHERVMARLSDLEKGRIEYPTTKKERGDVMDSIAIGLWASGRLR